jgi:hypothetical protein
MPPTHPAEKRVSYTFDALGMTINRTAFNLQNGFAPNSLSLYNGNSSGNGNISRKIHELIPQRRKIDFSVRP